MPDNAKVVLVVEDNDQNMELVTFLLEEAEYQVRRATDAEEARREFTRGGVDLVLMDMNLAGVDGLTLVSEFRNHPGNQTVPVLALTAHAMRGDRERFLAGGCDGYLAKPIDVKTFIKDVEGHLDRGRERAT